MTLPLPAAAFHWSREPWGDALRCRALQPVTQHLFTSKQLALPDPDAWRAAAASVSGRPDQVMRVTQVHGKSVRVLRRGAVPASASDARPEGDALVANEPGLILAVMGADCVPILIADPVQGAAAAVHAGWRGTCASVAQAAVATMRREFGTRPEDLLAAIGPSAGPDEYEVSMSVHDAFAAAGHGAAALERWFTGGAPKPHLDLWRANADQLAGAGMQGDRIFICGLSTVAHPEVFDSYRVNGENAGRMAGLIVVPRPS